MLSENKFIFKLKKMKKKKKNRGVQSPQNLEGSLQTPVCNLLQPLQPTPSFQPPPPSLQPQDGQLSFKMAS